MGGVIGKPKLQKHLAKSLGVSEQFLSGWKQGRKNVSPKTATRWGKVLKVAPARIVFAPADESIRAGILGLD